MSALEIKTNEAANEAVPLLKRFFKAAEIGRMWPLYLIFAIFTLVALLAPLIAPFDPLEQDLFARLKPPGTVAGGNIYLLGTDELGRDLLSRIIYGARISMMVALLSVSVSMISGTAIGLVAGYFRGPAEIILMRLVDIFLSIPAILLAIITVAVLGPGLQNLVIVLGFTRWPRYARVAYGQTLGVANTPYVAASRFIGLASWRILLRHILPNIIAPLIVVPTLRLDDHLGVRAVIPWPGSAAADPELGFHFKHRAQLHGFGMVDFDPDRGLFVHAGALGQYDRRFPARPLRPIFHQTITRNQQRHFPHAR